MNYLLPFSALNHVLALPFQENEHSLILFIWFLFLTHFCCIFLNHLSLPQLLQVEIKPNHIN